MLQIKNKTCACFLKFIMIFRRGTKRKLETIRVRSLFWWVHSGMVPYSSVLQLRALLLSSEKEWSRNCSLKIILARRASTLYIQLERLWRQQTSCGKIRTEQVFNLKLFSFVNRNSTSLFHWQRQFQLFRQHFGIITELNLYRGFRNVQIYSTLY